MPRLLVMLVADEGCDPLATWTVPFADSGLRKAWFVDWPTLRRVVQEATDVRHRMTQKGDV